MDVGVVGENGSKEPERPGVPASRADYASPVRNTLSREERSERFPVPVSPGSSGSPLDYDSVPPPPSLRPPGAPPPPLVERISARKILRRIADAWHDLVRSRSLRFATRLLFTNWHSGHDTLEDIFRDVAPGKDETVVDVGCGLGRVVAFLASKYPQSRIIGIEADDTALFAKEIFARNPNIEIRHGDFEALYPKEATFFYIFPPTEGDFLRILKRLVDDNATADTTIVAKGALGGLGYFKLDPSWTIQPVLPPKSRLRQLLSTHFIYQHQKRGPGYHYGVILRKKVARALAR